LLNAKLPLLKKIVLWVKIIKKKDAVMTPLLKIQSVYMFWRVESFSLISCESGVIEHFLKNQFSLKKNISNRIYFLHLFAFK